MSTAVRASTCSASTAIIPRGVTLAANTLTSIERIFLHAGHDYDLTTADGNVAAGGTLRLAGNKLGSAHNVSFDGSAESDGKFRLTGGKGDDLLTGGARHDMIRGGGGADILTGGGGGDRLSGNGGHDIFVYGAVSDSTSKHYDTVTDFNATVDHFDLPFAVTGIDAHLTTGELGRAHFDNQLKHAIKPAKLAAHHAVLFTPDAGALAGHTFLIVDANGVAGYQAGQDFVIDLGTSPSLAGLGTGDFI